MAQAAAGESAKSGATSQKDSPQVQRMEESWAAMGNQWEINGKLVEINGSQWKSWAEVWHYGSQLKTQPKRQSG